MSHKHVVAAYRFNAGESGIEPRGRYYVYSYDLRCPCGANRTEQFTSAEAAEAAEAKWRAAGAVKEGAVA